MFKKLRNMFSKPSATDKELLKYKMVEEIPVEYRPTQTDLDTAVLHILNPQFRSSRVGVEVGSVSRQTVTDEFALIDKYRIWLKTQKDPGVTTAYNHWLDFFEQSAQEADRAIRDDARAKWTAKWMESRLKFDKIREFSKTLPRPENQ